MADEAQEAIDAFYWQNGPCCAGCDWWRSYNSISGECRKAAPVSGKERASLLGMYNVSASVPAGHPLTPRGHSCGDFKDEFDWTTLPLTYRRRVGCPA